MHGVVTIGLGCIKILSKRKIYSKATIAESNGVFQIEFTQTIGNREFPVEVSIVDVDVKNGQILIDYGRDNSPFKRP